MIKINSTKINKNVAISQSTKNTRTATAPFRMAFGNMITEGGPGYIDEDELMSSTPKVFKQRIKKFIKDGHFPNNLAYKISRNSQTPNEKVFKTMLLIEVIEKNPKYFQDAGEIAKETLEIAKKINDKGVQSKLQNKIKELDYVYKSVPFENIHFYLKNIYGKKIMNIIYKVLLK